LEDFERFLPPFLKGVGGIKAYGVTLEELCVHPSFLRGVGGIKSLRGNSIRKFRIFIWKSLSWIKSIYTHKDRSKKCNNNDGFLTSKLKLRLRVGVC
jgi:hypothetical protein